MQLHQDLWIKKFKYLFDVTISVTLLLFLLPGLPLLAILIYLDSPGSIFFRQLRVGKNGKVFLMWKFRSMYQNSELQHADLKELNDMPGNVLFKIYDDPRVTRIGSFMRRYSIDELPQLWNVLKGDISLVGPRPALPLEVDKYMPYQSQRLNVIPGITGLWQVSGRSNIAFEQQVEMDLEYIRKCSFFYDIWLLLKTIPSVFNGEGAY